MKNKLFAILIMFSTISCNKKKLEIYNDKSINFKTINNEKPIYTLSISVANPYEAYVNDMPVEKDYKKGSTNTELPINDFILKSGIQTVKIILFPENDKKVVDKSGINYVDIKIYKYPNDLSNMSLKDRILVKSFNLKDLLEAPILIKEFQFDAKVPYDVTGWSQSENLLKENQDNLRKEVKEKFEEIKMVLAKKSIDKWTQIVNIREQELNKSLYLSELEISDEIKEDQNYIRSITKMKNIENYDMKIYGKGKIVTLERIDALLKGESVIQGESAKTTRVYGILLHRPKLGAQLEIIR